MKPNPILFKKQYIGHARHEGPFRENTIPLYEYLIDELKYDIVEADIVFTKDNIPVLNHSIHALLYIDGVKYDVDITTITHNELLRYSILQEKYQSINTAEEFIKLGSLKKKCIMLDMTFQHYTFRQHKILYKIVKKYGMLENTIWGDPSILKLSLLNRKLICQFSGSWGRKLLLTTYLKSFLCGTTIMSFSYYGGNITSFSSIPKHGHRLGFLMKVATVNEQSQADEFWNIGTDLINTDTLLNVKKQFINE